MSGRGRGKGGRGGKGRGGKGRGSNKNSNADSTKRTERKSISDYQYYIGSAKQASDCGLITSYLINYIRKTYTNGDDIGTALEERTETDFDSIMPTLTPAKLQPVASSATEEDKARAKELDDTARRQMEMLYEAEIKSFVERKNMYEANRGKAFAFIYGQCNKVLQSKLQTRTDYDSEVKGNPIKLLNAIEEHSMSYVEHKYETSIVLDLSLIHI